MISTTLIDHGFSGATSDHVLGQTDGSQAAYNSLGNIAGPATLCAPDGVAINGNNLTATNTSNSRYVVFGGY